MATLRFQALEKATSRKPVSFEETARKSEIFGSNVFGDKAMRQFLTPDAYKAVKNAVDSSLVSGGSSGGSAVNVAKEYTVFSIGGDTGGSVRQPAGYNQIYGLKPTYGRISRYGLMAYASSTDCVGPIAKSVEDIRIVLNAMSGKDAKDQTTYASAEISEASITNSNDIKTVGYFKNFILGWF